ncbi:WD repeat-containing protein 6 [Conoideocrella luteorostrata]|uniref:WD repeat-containing protein 6 n=1 Tax=Conoideocrella luteorostrata TaxID=1105319 RepID=A0AAJ0CHZ2_9HYPO|nr:WD repeat-containing protein 6 [Conoideocrella luteorostrata]
MAHQPAPSKGIMLKRQLAQVPITALAFFTSTSGREYILAGEDSELTIYEGAVHNNSNNTSEPIFRVAVFEDQPIHGIRVSQSCSESRILLWGAARIALFNGLALESGSQPVLLASTTAPDWVYDAAISPFKVGEAVLATAHNEVVHMAYQASSGGGEKLLLGDVVSPSRPMLYVARLRWISEREVLVAAGTVFGDVLVWKYHVDMEDTHTMLFVLRGHEGSIYGLDISPELLTAHNGSSLRLLATCSDDRTIRIWDISEHSTPHESTHATRALETGFKAAESYDELQPASGDGQITPVAVAMGHVSRIWGVRFGVAGESCDLGPKGLSVYSFGEDSTTQRWRLHLDKSQPPPPSSTTAKTTTTTTRTASLVGRLVYEHTYALHNGKHLWARDLKVRSGGRVDILAGGADSKIVVIEDFAAGEEEGVVGTKLMTVDVPDLLQSLARSPRLGISREMISRYDFVREDKILAVTNVGRLCVGNLSTRTWDEVDVAGSEHMAEDLKLCYVLRKVGHGAAVIGTTNGKVFFCLGGRLVLSAELPGRIVEINCLSDTAASSSSSSSSSDSYGSIELLAHLHGSSVSYLLTLDPSGQLLQDHQQITGLDGRFVAVSAARLNSLLIVGSRHGYISLLTLQNQQWRPILDTATRSRDAITSLVPLPSGTASTTTPSSLYVLATSRDGKYRIYHIDTSLSNASLTLLHETSPPFGPMIEGAWFTDGPTPQLILYGFRSKDFVIWNESTREELATVDCGGAHRTFRLDHSAQDPARYRFAYTRTSKLSIYSQARIPHRTVKPGTHGREIRALSSSSSSSPSKRYIASGAEDTSIRIWEYVDKDTDGREGAKQGRGGQTEMRYLACMKAHVTGIQKLRWFQDDYLFSSAGNEEFFVWRVRTVNSAYTGLAVVCEGVFADKSPTGDLRVMDFDVSTGEEGQGIIVTLAFSNSTLKTYEYGDNGSFKLLSAGRYTGACITQLRHLGHRDNRIWITTASTDGHLALWSTKLKEAMLQSYTLREAAPVHQSSIKSLDMIKDNNMYRILTGGDDNAVGLVVLAEGLDKEGNTTYGIASRGIVRRAHAAAINGVALLPNNHDREMSETLGVSVSNDQRVRVWRISTSNPQKIALASCVSSGVADPGDIVAIHRGRMYGVIVGGVGVEAWSVM